jgi:hypothetical protein
MTILRWLHPTDGRSRWAVNFFSGKVTRIQVSKQMRIPLAVRLKWTSNVGMSFKLKKLNHRPKWYRDNCRAEDGGSPAFRAMLTNDMKFIGADIDTHLTYQERIGNYEEKWDATMSGGGILRSDPLQIEMMKVEEQECLKDYKPFEDEPFKSIDELMTEAGLDEKTVHEFLRWRSRRAKTVEIEVPTVVEPAHKSQARQKSGRLKNQNPFFG